MPRYGNNARGFKKMIADDKAEANAINMADVLHAALSSPLVSRPYPKMCGCGYPTHYGRCQPKLMPTTPQQAVVMPMSNHDDLKRATEKLLEVATILQRALAIQPSQAVTDVLASAQRALNEEEKAAQSPAGLTFDDAETATILAALRSFQVEILNNRDSFHDEGHFSEYDPLSPTEIDALCEKINFGESHTINLLTPVLRATDK